MIAKGSTFWISHIWKNEVGGQMQLLMTFIYQEVQN